ncbi:MAG: Appr-p processing protein [Ramlibacter sp.]|nr:Appr-p processing protein [Ramlibacter sp.]
MIEPTSGNLLLAPADALVNTVNTEGVMGKGIALQFRNSYPAMYQNYLDACKSGRIMLGEMHVYDLGAIGDGPRWIINFPTKGHWRSKSRIADIEEGLKSLVQTIQRLQIRSIAVPPLGCGNGGLDWAEVKPRILKAFEALPQVKVLLYAPGDAPAAADMPNATAKPKMTLAQATLIALMNQYRRGLLDPFVSLLEVQKLMYFMQEAGLNLKLSYKAHHYGPYATNLRQVLIRMEQHYLQGFGDGEDQPKKPLLLINDAIEESDDFLAKRPDVQEQMERVAKLIDGYEDAYGMELLSTMHWVMCHDPEARYSCDAAIAAVHRWSGRKSELLKAPHLRKAWERLKEQRWDDESRSAIH